MEGHDIASEPFIENILLFLLCDGELLFFSFHCQELKGTFQQINSQLVQYVLYPVKILNTEGELLVLPTG